MLDDQSYNRYELEEKESSKDPEEALYDSLSQLQQKLYEDDYSYSCVVVSFDGGSRTIRDCTVKILNNMVFFCEDGKTDIVIPVSRISYFTGEKTRKK